MLQCWQHRAALTHMHLSRPCCTLQNKIAIANGEEPPHRGNSQAPQETAAKAVATGSSDLRALLEVRGWTGDHSTGLCSRRCLWSVLSSLLWSASWSCAEGRGQGMQACPSAH